MCQEYSRRNCKDPSIPREIPAFTWITIEMDLFMFDDHLFLLVANVISWFPVVKHYAQYSKGTITKSSKDHEDI